jgi:hypothetical protein
MTVHHYSGLNGFAVVREDMRDVAAFHEYILPTDNSTGCHVNHIHVG